MKGDTLLYSSKKVTNLMKIFLVILCYESMRSQLSTQIPDCVQTVLFNKDNATQTVVSLNLNRIKMFYKKTGDIFIPSSLKQKDWHNYSQIEEEGNRNGTGEQGKPGLFTKEDNNNFEKKLYTKYGYNAMLSNQIQLNRSLPDVRNPKCKNRLYLESLPIVSVIVPYRNEHWSVLMRTVHSVINRSPERLLKEIILVDDANDNKGFLKESIDEYLEENLPKVKVLHLTSHNGLVGARLAGIKEATGEVLVFLDSHTEANVNWLPPLLEPIALDYKTVVVPTIDTIKYDTFEYRPRDNGLRGSFDWTFTYQRIPLTPKDEKNLPEPFETPVMTGGIFAISLNFFLELGGYDPELRNWGGDQYELSFKIWQCGGRLLEAPCSRFGHIIRAFNYAERDFYTSKNYRRIAEVWMDEYAKYVYEKVPAAKTVDPGDLTEQKLHRKRLKCKPFKWFMTQIAFDLIQQNPPVDILPYAEGRIRPKGSPYLCVDGNHGKFKDPFVLKRCHSAKLYLPLEQDDQKFMLTWFNDVQLKSRYMCWDLIRPSPGSPLFLHPCHHNGGNQQWKYYMDSKIFAFQDNTTSICLDHNPKNRNLFVNVCNYNSNTQLWEIDIIHKEQMAKWNASNSARALGPVEEWKESNRKENR